MKGITLRKYIIIPKTEFRSEVITAESESDAMAQFAADMDSDMNNYFVAVEESEVEQYLDDIEYKNYEKFVTNWMKRTLIKDFDIDDAELAAEIADRTYNIYSEGDGDTEYESIEKAYEEFDEEDYFNREQ